MTTKNKKQEFIGKGAMIQLLGTGLIVVGWFFGEIAGVAGSAGGIACIIYGGLNSTSLLCGECGNSITKESKLCPYCKTAFKD